MDRLTYGTAHHHVLPVGDNAKKAKVFPEPRAHRAALISISITLGQTPVEAASPHTRG